MKHRVLFIVISVAAVFNISPVFATSFSPNATYEVCFTPGGGCVSKIVDAIGKAKHQILVQTYSFTSKQIIAALIQAKMRGVDVEVLLDKSQLRGRNPSAELLESYGVFTRIDGKPSIAHSSNCFV